MDPDGLGQIGQGLRVKALSRLIQAGLHLGDGQRDGALPLGGQVRVAEQGIQPPAQTGLKFSFCHIKPRFLL